MIRKVKENITYVGEDDLELDLFEGEYIVPNGMAYNSYVIEDEKTAVIDSMDRSGISGWLDNISEVLGDRSPDFLVVQHMEPDHSAGIKAFAEKYPGAEIIVNGKSAKMLGRFFPGVSFRTREVKNGDALDLGRHKLTFIFAPMVHWPEVMFSYESADKVLFSADAFGKFGAIDTDEDWACEARRYYFNIVGRYGAQVQKALKAAAELDIETICPLHGPILSDNLDYYFDLYNKWSSYTPEDEGIFIAYTSVYGNTREAAELLRDELKAAGVETVEITDLARSDMAEAVEDAFRYDRLVLATTTFNGDIFPFMKHFIEALKLRNYSNRTVAFIENGSWSPMAGRVMKGMLDDCSNLTYAVSDVTINSALDDDSRARIRALAEELAGIHPQLGEKVEKSATKWVCSVCGYEYEGEVLPEGFRCPLCKVRASKFKKVEE